MDVATTLIQHLQDKKCIVCYRVCYRVCMVMFSVEQLKGESFCKVFGLPRQEVIFRSCPTASYMMWEFLRL